MGRQALSALAGGVVRTAGKLLRVLNPAASCAKMVVDETTHLLRATATEVCCLRSPSCRPAGSRRDFLFEL